MLATDNRPLPFGTTSVQPVPTGLNSCHIAICKIQISTTAVPLLWLCACRVAALRSIVVCFLEAVPLLVSVAAMLFFFLFIFAGKRQEEHGCYLLVGSCSEINRLQDCSMCDKLTEADTLHTDMMDSSSYCWTAFFCFIPQPSIYSI